jgi:hypothetical protein
LDDGESLESGLGEIRIGDKKEVFSNKDEEKWKLYRKEYDRCEEAIEEGLELFGKYFRTLWD